MGVGNLQCRVGFSKSRRRRVPSHFCIKCCEKKKDEYTELEHVSVERPPYYSYMDSTSGQLEPASGARSSLPEEDLWPEGTVNQVRAGRAPPPTGESSGTPSYGSKPGSRRKKGRTSISASSDDGSSSEAVAESTDTALLEVSVEEPFEDDSPDSSSSDYVVYQSEPAEEEASEFDLDKRLGVPHPFVDPKIKKPIEGTLTSEELWWNWRKPEKEQWSRWQRRRPDVETVSVHENSCGLCFDFAIKMCLCVCIHWFFSDERRFKSKLSLMV